MNPLRQIIREIMTQAIVSRDDVATLTAFLSGDLGLAPIQSLRMLHLYGEHDAQEGLG